MTARLVRMGLGLLAGATLLVASSVLWRANYLQDGIEKEERMAVRYDSFSVFFVGVIAVFNALFSDKFPGQCGLLTLVSCGIITHVLVWSEEIDAAKVNQYRRNNACGAGSIAKHYTVGGVMAYLGFAIMLAAQSATEEFCKLGEHKVFKLMAVALTVVFGTIGIFVLGTLANAGMSETSLCFFEYFSHGEDIVIGIATTFFIMILAVAGVFGGNIDMTSAAAFLVGSVQFFRLSDLFNGSDTYDDSSAEKKAARAGFIFAWFMGFTVAGAAILAHGTSERVQTGAPSSLVQRTAAVVAGLFIIVGASVLWHGVHEEESASNLSKNEVREKEYDTWGVFAVAVLVLLYAFISDKFPKFGSVATVVVLGLISYAINSSKTTNAGLLNLVRFNSECWGGAERDYSVRYFVGGLLAYIGFCIAIISMAAGNIIVNVYTEKKMLGMVSAGVTTVLALIAIFVLATLRSSGTEATGCDYSYVDAVTGNTQTIVVAVNFFIWLMTMAAVATGSKEMCVGVAMIFGSFHFFALRYLFALTDKYQALGATEVDRARVGWIFTWFTGIMAVVAVMPVYAAGSDGQASSSSSSSSAAAKPSVKKPKEEAPAKKSVKKEAPAAVVDTAAYPPAEKHVVKETVEKFEELAHQSEPTQPPPAPAPAATADVGYIETEEKP